MVWNVLRLPPLLFGSGSTASSADSLLLFPLSALPSILAVRSGHWRWDCIGQCHTAGLNKRDFPRSVAGHDPDNGLQRRWDRRSYDLPLALNGFEARVARADVFLCCLFMAATVASQQHVQTSASRALHTRGINVAFARFAGGHGVNSFGPIRVIVAGFNVHQPREL